MLNLIKSSLNITHTYNDYVTARLETVNRLQLLDLGTSMLHANLNLVYNNNIFRQKVRNLCVFATLKGALYFDRGAVAESAIFYHKVHVYMHSNKLIIVLLMELTN